MDKIKEKIKELSPYSRVRELTSLEFEVWFKWSLQEDQGLELWRQTREEIKNLGKQDFAIGLIAGELMIRGLECVKESSPQLSMDPIRVWVEDWIVGLVGDNPMPFQKEAIKRFVIPVRPIHRDKEELRVAWKSKASQKVRQIVMECVDRINGQQEIKKSNQNWLLMASVQKNLDALKTLSKNMGVWSPCDQDTFWSQVCYGGGSWFQEVSRAIVEDEGLRWQCIPKDSLKWIQELIDRNLIKMHEGQEMKAWAERDCLKEALKKAKRIGTDKHQEIRRI